MKLTVTVSDVDYDSLAELLLPALSRQMENTWFPVDLTENGRPTEAAKAMLRRMPERRKNALLCNAVNRNEKNIAWAMMNAAKEKGISLHISDIHCECED